MTGKTISHYRILEKLGEGGMGVVYKAEDLRLERTVALKFLAPHALESEEHKARFIHEAKAAAAIDHPNICTVYEIDEAEGQTFISMAFVDGPSLKQKIEERPLKLDEALDIAIQIGQGLQAAHKKDIFHRDIKGANVMLSSDERAEILDFGLAHLAGRTKLTKTGSTLGTPAYMSPEQVRGEQVDSRTDIWSLGVVVYEMVTDQLPFKGEVEEAVSYGILNTQPEPLTAVRAGVPIELDRVVAKALAKSADERYQHVDEILVDLRAVGAGRARPAQPVRPAPARKSRGAWHVAAQIAMAAVLVAGAAGVTWWLTRPPAAPQRYELRRLTSDSGLTYQPALSPDGRFVAYASDRGGEENLDIWVRDLAGGEPLRLTDHETDDYEPAFSPDGSKVAFRSDRAGGGIYVVPVLGGDARLIAKEGRRPRFSPDGEWIAYWVGPTGWPVPSKVFVVASAGGQPRELQADFRNALDPIWSPDGKHVLFQRLLESGGLSDWWVVPVEGGAAIKTGVSEVLARQGLESHSGQPGLPPGEWDVDGNHVLFSATLGDTTNLWRFPISSKTWQPTGEAERLTFGTALEVQPSVEPGGHLAFTSLTQNLDVWSLPIDANQGMVTGDIERLTTDAANDTWPSISIDGKTLTFLSTRSGNQDVWIKELEAGRVTNLTASPVEETLPLISADGSTVAYRGRGEDQGWLLYVMPASSGVAEMVCEGCSSPQDWSPDGTQILHSSREPQFSKLEVFDLASRTNTECVRHPDYPLFNARFSPDGRWISFHSRTGPATQQVFIVPFRPGKKLAESEWIAVTDGVGSDRRPAWSPDGNLLYFTSERDGYRCIWAQRLHLATKQPVGSAFAVRHFHSRHRSLFNVANVGWLGLSVARDKLVFATAELTGNIWMLEPASEQ